MPDTASNAQSRERNAVQTNCARALLFEKLRTADADPEVRVVIIRGAGPCFSAGYDVATGQSRRHGRYQLTTEVGAWHVLVGWFEMWDMDTPIIAQVHGHCLAGGTEAAAAADLLYVAEDARIGYPAVRAMSSPDMVWQPWFMGMRQAMEAPRPETP